MVKNGANLTVPLVLQFTALTPVIFSYRYELCSGCSDFPQPCARELNSRIACCTQTSSRLVLTRCQHMTEPGVWPDPEVQTRLIGLTGPLILMYSIEQYHVLSSAPKVETCKCHLYDLFKLFEEDPDDSRPGVSNSVSQVQGFAF